MTTWVRDHLMLTASAGVVALLLVAFVIFPGDGSRTVTAHFDRAVAVYPGTDLRVMGVQIGEVTDVVPDGNSVRVEMTYDSEYKLPADAQAAVVTPTLVADRYVQVLPAYGSGPVMADGGDIPLERTQTPVELDRMYRALDDIAVTLGPKAGSTDGALNALLTAGEKALKGNGELGSETIRNLSQAADTFARNRGPLFDNVRSLAELTETLAANDTAVQSFLSELTSVSGQLEGERDELRDVLASLARVLGTVKGFIKENREVLGDDIELLSSLLQRVDNQKDAVGLVLQKGALAMGNLAVAFEPGTGTFGSRVQVGPAFSRLDLFLCQTIANTGDFDEGQAAQLCSLFKNLLGPLIPKAPEGTEATAETTTPDPTATTGPAPTVLPEQSGLRNGKLPDLFSLLGGDRG